MTQLTLLVAHLALAVWVGGAVTVAWIVAPHTFRTMPTREQAASITGPVLARLEVLGVAVGGVTALAMALLAVADGGTPLSLIRAALAVAMLALLILEATTIRGRMAAVRAQMGPRPIDAVPEDDPLRREYRRLHRMSVLVFSLSMLLGAALIALLALRQGTAAP